MLNLFRQVLFITIMNVTRNDVIGNVCCQAITVCMKSQRFLCYSQGTQHSKTHLSGFFDLSTELEKTLLLACIETIPLC